MKIIIKIAPAAILCLALQSCAITFQEQYPEAYKKYTQLEPNKALAFVKRDNGTYVWGYGSNHETIQEAKESALFQCWGRRVPYKIEKECEIYFVNDKNLVDPQPEED